MDIASLKSEVARVVNDADAVLKIADELPLPASIKVYVNDVLAVLNDVQSFLNA